MRFSTGLLLIMLLLSLTWNIIQWRIIHTADALLATQHTRIREGQEEYRRLFDQAIAVYEQYQGLIAHYIPNPLLIHHGNSEIFYLQGVWMRRSPDGGTLQKITSPLHDEDVLVCYHEDQLPFREEVP